jgi:hypothetical protein
MIHHISIPAQNPRHVAEVLAEVWNGKAAPFPPIPGSYIVFRGDEYGSAVEVFPLGTELVPGDGDEQAGFVQKASSSQFIATHAAISVPASQEQIEEIGRREGWRVLRCNRDSFFDVIEFWVENRLMLELLPPAIANQYIEFAQPHNIEKFFATADLMTTGS